MKQHVQMEKEEVKKMFLFSKNDIEQKLNFVDSLQRLGISYHFEREIDEALEQIHNTFTNNKEIITTKEGSLHFFVLAFRLLRQSTSTFGRYVVLHPSLIIRLFIFVTIFFFFSFLLIEFP